MAQTVQASRGMSLRSPVLGYMSKQLFTLHGQMHAREARDLFVTHDITIAPVIDDAGRLCGVVTATDLLSRAADLEKPETHVEGVMSRDPITVREETNVASAASLMTTCDIHHLVVTDATGRPVGVLSTVDVVTAMADSELPQPVEWFVSDELVTVEPETTARDANDVLNEAGVSAAVVIDGSTPVGAISKLGLLRATGPAQQVSEVMDRSIRCVPGEMSVTRVARTLSEGGVRRVLVTDEDGDVVGIVTSTDLARFAGRIIHPDED